MKTSSLSVTRAGLPAALPVLVGCGEVKTFNRLIALCVLAGAAGLLSFPSAGNAQPLVLRPGETKSNLTLTESIFREQATGFSSVAKVDLGAAGDNQVQLFAHTTFSFIGGAGPDTATARAVMSLDFCVPNFGSTSCGDGTSSDEDLSAEVSFGVQRIWQFVTFASGTARFGISARIVDRNDNNRLVAFQALEDASQGSFLGKTTAFQSVPITLPQFAGSKPVPPTVLTVRVRRGHVHRLEIFVAAAVDAGVRFNATASVDAESGIPFPGGVTVSNLAITVSPSATDQLAELKDRVAALERHLPEVGASSEARAEGLDERLNTLSEGVAEVTRDVEGLKTESQAAQSAVAGMQTRVGTLETQVGSLRMRFDGHTHDCVLLKPKSGKDSDDDDDRRGIGKRFTISCGVPR
jgi:outer membrane murein-binding lipoprotein Lpp